MTSPIRTFRDLDEDLKELAKLPQEEETTKKLLQFINFLIRETLMCHMAIKEQYSELIYKSYHLLLKQEPVQKRNWTRSWQAVLDPLTKLFHSDISQTSLLLDSCSHEDFSSSQRKFYYQMKNSFYLKRLLWELARWSWLHDANSTATFEEHIKKAFSSLLERVYDATGGKNISKKPDKEKIAKTFTSLKEKLCIGFELKGKKLSEFEANQQKAFFSKPKHQEAIEKLLYERLLEDHHATCQEEVEEMLFHSIALYNELLQVKELVKTSPPAYLKKETLNLIHLALLEKSFCDLLLLEALKKKDATIQPTLERLQLLFSEEKREEHKAQDPFIKDFLHHDIGLISLTYALMDHGSLESVLKEIIERDKQIKECDAEKMGMITHLDPSLIKGSLANIRYQEILVRIALFHPQRDIFTIVMEKTAKLKSPFGTYYLSVEAKPAYLYYLTEIQVANSKTMKDLEIDVIYNVEPNYSLCFHEITYKSMSLFAREEKKHATFLSFVTELDKDLRAGKNCVIHDGRDQGVAGCFLAVYVMWLFGFDLQEAISVISNTNRIQTNDPLFSWQTFQGNDVQIASREVRLQAESFFQQVVKTRKEEGKLIEASLQPQERKKFQR